MKSGELGFEPRQADPESAVLPLHHSPRPRLAVEVASELRTRTSDSTLLIDFGDFAPQPLILSPTFAEGKP
jgi:hypothetical protein